MANQEERPGKLASRLAEVIAQEILASEPDMDADIDDIEEQAVQAAKIAFDAVLAAELELRRLQLPSQLPCPDCGRPCRVQRGGRTIQGRLGTADIDEPFCRCSKCERDFFPATRNATAR